MTCSDWIALIVGGYAAIVATTVLAWNILRERRKIKVRISYGLGIGVLKNSEIVAIEVINNGLRPINIQEVGFILSNRTKVVNPSAQHDFFGWLRDRDGKSYYIPRTAIENMRKQAKEAKTRIVAAYVRDSTSTYYKTKISKNAAWFNK